MSEYDDRLVTLERRLRELELELADLRRTKPGRTATLEPPAPVFVAPPVRRVEPPVVPPPREFELPPEREPFDLSRLLGARTLALTGGIVSLLGIVFLFALAVQRGWIGPVARVSLGAAASALMLGAGWWLYRRFGETFASTAAAGVGVAGGYATLLAAAARYDLVSDPAALVLAAVIAAVATVTALAWSDELLAGLGLVGAILAPLALGLADAFAPDEVVRDADGLPAAAVGFALVMPVAALAVSFRRQWSALLVVAVVSAGVQVAVHVADAPDADRAAAALAVAYSALVLAAGVVESLRRGRLTELGASLVVAASAFSGYAAAMLLDGRALGAALLGSALANGVLAAALFRRARDLASLLCATALALAAVGTAQLVSGATLTIAWAAEAAVLAWLAERLREPRFRIAALGWLGLALLHSLAFDAPVSLLFRQTAHPASGVPSLLALSAVAVLTAWLPADFEREPGDGRAAFAVNALLHLRRRTRLVLLALAGVLAVEAASLALLELVPSWSWGHVAVTSLWGAVAVALMLGGLRVAGLAAAGATAWLAVLYDVNWLTGDARWCSLAVAAATALGAALIFERGLGAVSAAGTTTGAAFAVGAALGIAGGDGQWLLVLGVAAVYAALGAALLRTRRDQSTLLWALGLTLGTVAASQLLDGFWLVLALASAAVPTAVLARFEERLDFASLALLVLALGVTLEREATLRDLFTAQRHPGEGVPAALAVVGAAGVYAALRTRWRGTVIWAASVVAILAASLAFLELAEFLGGDVGTEFQRGHTAVSAVWGLIGLALLYAGLVRRSTTFRLAGFALFGVALAKLFVYDLAFLSSVARALSFLAVGALLIAGGFFYQRLASAPDREGRAGA
jgi:uncharacterized membrane protein